MKCKSRNLFAQFLKKFKNKKKEDKDQNFKGEVRSRNSLPISKVSDLFFHYWQFI